MGRSPIFSQTDLVVQHDVRFSGLRLNLGVNVFNLFDQDTVTRLFTTRYRDPVAGITDEQFLAGFDVQALAAARNLRPDARFNQADQFLGARTIRVQARFSF